MLAKLVLRAADTAEHIGVLRYAEFRAICVHVPRFRRALYAGPVRF
ncbi:hypothetical protein [Amycolatopsis sp. cmx-11-51]